MTLITITEIRIMHICGTYSTVNEFSWYVACSLRWMYVSCTLHCEYIFWQLYRSLNHIYISKYRLYHCHTTMHSRNWVLLLESIIERKSLYLSLCQWNVIDQFKDNWGHNWYWFFRDCLRVSSDVLWHTENFDWVTCLPTDVQRNWLP